MPKEKRVSKPSTELPVPKEWTEQRNFVFWFRRQYPKTRIFAIPNGGSRDIIEAAGLKAQGVSAGVPDLMIPAWRLFIEMKRTKGSATSDEQKDWAAYLISCGYTHFYAFGCDDGMAKLMEFMRNGGLA